MSTLVCFHAHPDDEVFTTGGIMRLAADAGHRVVLVIATDGALGEFPDGILRDGETLVERRRFELESSATVKPSSSDAGSNWRAPRQCSAPTVW